MYNKPFFFLQIFLYIRREKAGMQGICFKKRKKGRKGVCHSGFVPDAEALGVIQVCVLSCSIVSDSLQPHGL